MRCNMSRNELKNAVLSGSELKFSRGGRDYLLYGWEQCDGCILSLECEGELIWQTAPMPREACAEEFLGYYSEM